MRKWVSNHTHTTNERMNEVTGAATPLLRSPSRTLPSTMIQASSRFPWRATSSLVNCGTASPLLGSSGAILGRGARGFFSSFIMLCRQMSSASCCDHAGAYPSSRFACG